MNPLHIELGLERIKSVWKNLPPLPEETRVVVVGGTNGKGSCVLTLEHLLRQSGLGVGSYTSPHLVRFNERIRLNESEISDELLCHHLERVESARGDVDLTYFEFTTLAALSFFVEEKPDVVILEVGLGGRLDAVNILNPEIAVLTSVDLDHQDWLGNNIESIGREKAGIFRPESWAVLAEAELPSSVYQHITDIGAKPLCRGNKFDIETQDSQQWFCFDGERYALPLVSVPEASLSAALCVSRLLLGKLTKEIIDSLTSLTLPARFERVNLLGAEFILDCAHNPAAAKQLSTKLLENGITSVQVVLGMMQDKDVEGFIAALAPQVRRWLLVVPETPRAYSLARLATKVRDLSNAEIIELGAIKDLKIDDLDKSIPTLVSGSFYTVGEFLKYQAGEQCA